MRVILPVTIDDSKFVSSSVPENDAPVWSASTSYTTGQRTMRNHKVWESLSVGANLNHVPETSPEWWLDLGATNRWAAFDQKVGTVTTGTNVLTFVLKPGQIQSVAFLNMNAETVRVVLKDATGGNIVYDHTEQFLAGDVIADWYQYFFAPFRRRTDGVFTGVPPYSLGELTITMSNPVANVTIGTIIVGTSTQLGLSQWGAKVGIIDYSRKETDAFGNFMVVERAFSKRMSIDIIVRADFVDEVYRILALYRAQPLLWIGAENIYTALIVYGFYKSFDINIAYYSDSYCSLEIEGLT